MAGDNDVDDNAIREKIGQLICRGNQQPLFVGNNIIGAMESRCDIIITDLSISDVHAIIKVNMNVVALCDLRSAEGTFIEQHGAWNRVRYKDVLLESATNLRFGSVHCSLYIGVEASGYGEGSSSSSAIVRRSEEIETQAMDEAFLLGQPTMHNNYSNPSYKTMIASAVTQVMDPLLFDELGEDGAGAGGSAGDDDRNEEMQMSDTHSEHTLSPPQSPSLANFADNTAAEVTLTSLPVDILDDDDGDDDDSSQESADLFHVDVAIADTLVDEELPEVVAVAPEKTVPATTGRKRSRLDEESSEDEDDGEDGRVGADNAAAAEVALLGEQDATLTLVGELPTQIIDIEMPDDLIDDGPEAGSSGGGGDGDGDGGTDGIVLVGRSSFPTDPNRPRLRGHSTPPEPIVSPLLRLPDCEMVHAPGVLEPAPVAEPIPMEETALDPDLDLDPVTVPVSRPQRKSKAKNGSDDSKAVAVAEPAAVAEAAGGNSAVRAGSATAAAAAVRAAPKRGAGKSKPRTIDGDVCLPTSVEREAVAAAEEVIAPSIASVTAVQSGIEPASSAPTASVGRRGSRAATSSKESIEMDTTATTTSTTSSSSSSSSSATAKQPVSEEQTRDTRQRKGRAGRSSLVATTETAVVEVVALLEPIPDVRPSKAGAKKRGRAAIAAPDAEILPLSSAEDEPPPQKQTREAGVPPVEDQSVGEAVAESKAGKRAASVRFTSPVVGQLVEFPAAGRRASKRTDPLPPSSPIQPPSPLSQSFAPSPRTVANTLFNQGSSEDAKESEQAGAGAGEEAASTAKKGKRSVPAKDRPLASPLPDPPSSSSAATATGAPGEQTAESAVRILFTALPEDLISKKDAEMLAGKIAGAVVVEDAALASHVILGEELKRTPNLLVALNSGAKYVVTLSWLRDSSKKGGPVQIPSLDKSKYIVRDKKKEALWGFSMERTLAMPRGRDQGVFSGYGVYYQIEDVSTVPPPEKMKDIVESGGGRWVQSAQGGGEASSVEELPVLVVTCPEAIQSARPPFRQLLAQLSDSESSSLTCCVLGDDARLGKKAAEMKMKMQVVGVFAVEAVLLAVLRQQLDLTESSSSHRIDVRALMVSDSSTGSKKTKQKERNSRRS